MLKEVAVLLKGVVGEQGLRGRGGGAAMARRFARQEQNYITKLTSLQYKRESLLPSTLPPMCSGLLP